jgi:hypothetical protein
MLFFFQSADDASDVESEKEIERNLMIHKEQVRQKFDFNEYCIWFYV